MTYIGAQHNRDIKDFGFDISWKKEAVDRLIVKIVTAVLST